MVAAMRQPGIRTNARLLKLEGRRMPDKLSEAWPRPTISPKRSPVTNGDRATQILQDALGIESDDVVNYYPLRGLTWPAGREQRARIIGEWQQTEAQFLARCRPSYRSPIPSWPWSPLSLP
jgi:hypothetical protein